MAIYLVAMKAYFFVMCLNWGLLLVASLAPVDVVSPIDQATIFNATELQADYPNYINGTSPDGTYYSNFTSQSLNSTADPFDTSNFGIADYFTWGLMALQWIVAIISPYYILSFFTMIGLHPLFVFGISGLIGVSFILMLIYYITGKGT